MSDAVKIIMGGSPVEMGNPLSTTDVCCFDRVQSAINVQNVPTELPIMALKDRKYLAIYNEGATTVYVGNDSVTTADGWPIPAGTYIGFALGPGVTLYGIVAAPPVTVRVLELA